MNTQSTSNDTPFTWRQAAGWTVVVLGAAAVAVGLFRETAWLLPILLVICSAAVLGIWWTQRTWRKTLDLAVATWSTERGRGPEHSAQSPRQQGGR